MNKPFTLTYYGYKNLLDELVKLADEKENIAAREKEIHELIKNSVLVEAK